MAVTTVTVSLVAGSIQVTPYAPVLKKSRHDKVQWKGSPQNLPFFVCFGDKSPFKHKHFYRNRPTSGVITTPVSDLEEYFKYSIEVGDIVLDPGIIIKR